MRIMLGAAVGALLALAASGGPAAAAEVDRLCYVREIAVYSDRVHVFCASPSDTDYIMAIRGSVAAQKIIDSAQGKVPFYALPLTDPMAEKLLILAAAAMAAHTPLQIDYDDNPGANPGGCGVDDCRRITGARATPF